MTIGKLFSTFFGMIKLDDAAYGEATKMTFKNALVVFVLVALSTALGSFFLTFDFATLIMAAIGTFIALVIIYFIVTLIFWGCARIFGGNGDYMAHYSGSSLIGMWAILSIIPFVGTILGSIGSLWGIVMNIFFVKKLHGLTMGRAAAAVLIPYAIFLILGLILFAVIVAMFATMFAAGGLAAA